MPRSEESRSEKESKMSKIKVTLIKSTIGCRSVQKATVEALGLKKIGANREFEDTPALRGMLNKVKHLVRVEEAE